MQKVEKFSCDYGIKIIKQYVEVDPKELRVDQTYQRGVEPQRVEAIKKSIAQYGFWPNAPIVINTDCSIVDGQQRWTAALELGLETIPATIIHFPTTKNEAAFYADINNYNTKQTPANFWHARCIAKHPMAEVLYKLEISNSSLFKGRIALKGTNKSNTLFTVSQTLQIMYSILSNTSQHYRQMKEKSTIQLINKFHYDEIEARCNLFLAFFYKTFGQDKKITPEPYSGIGVYAIVSFYTRAKNAGLFKDGGESVINKMRSYKFEQHFKQMSHLGRYESLISHYNKGKTQNPLSALNN